jgi:hypothetical protein
MTAPVILNALLDLHQCCTNSDPCPEALDEALEEIDTALQRPTPVLAIRRWSLELALHGIAISIVDAPKLRLPREVSLHESTTRLFIILLYQPKKWCIGLQAIQHVNWKPCCPCSLQAHCRCLKERHTCEQRD